jgi:DNA-binding beta-propeller fold protein YncE
LERLHALNNQPDVFVKKTVLSAALALALVPLGAVAGTFDALSKAWTYNHALSGVPGQISEIVAFDSITNTLWVAGVAGVDVLNAASGNLVQHIDTTAFGSINSVAIHNGLAAFAMESSIRTDPGTIRLFDTTTRALASGVNSISVGALPDMLTFTRDGSKLLVANEATPTVYGQVDPVGSVSIIDMQTRTVAATPTFAGVTQTGSYLRTNTGMDFEPEYIAINRAGTKAYVSLQEANGMAVLDLNSNTFAKVVGLGAKDFSLAVNGFGSSNFIDPSDEDTKANPITSLRSVAAKGLYQPDGMASYEVNGKTYVVMANEGDTREDDGDKARANLSGDLKRLNISTTDTTTDNVVTFGARSFSIRDVDGALVFDSGNQLDAQAILAGIYDDKRSDDKGVEPEGVELMVIGNRTYAFVGLERTTTSAVAVFDITDPANATFEKMIVTPGDVSPEGLKGFEMGGQHYLAIANEVSNTTSVYALAPVPEPETYAMLLAGLAVLGAAARRKRKGAAGAV